MNVLKTLILAAFIFASVAFIPFHHGWANYNQDKVIDYTGIIQEAVYENPHATAKVKDKDKTWTVVLAPTSRMQERGIKPAMLKKGASVRVVGYQHREIQDEMRAERIFVNGEKYELRR